MHSVIGHNRQLQELLHDIEEDTLAHAYLFAGKKHLGKFTVARWFAEQILTHGHRDGKEHLISLIRKNMHPDLLVLDALWVEGSSVDWNVIAKSSNVPQQHRAKAGVKTDTIGIEDVRALQERLYATPEQGSHTVCLIRSIERLHVTAANALLKILEEPPSHLLFCFTTESPGSIPATVVSRMRTLQFSAVQRSLLEDLVSKLPREEQDLLLSLAQGAPGIILTCMENAAMLRGERQAEIDAHRFLDTSPPLEQFRAMLAVAEESGTSSSFLRQLFLALAQRFRGDALEAEQAAYTARKCLRLLRSLQSNANRPLLALDFALQSRVP